MESHPRHLSIAMPGESSIRVKYPMPSSDNVSRAMKGNRANNTSPEIILRKALCGQGIRGYRLNWRSAPGKPDLAFPGKKLAIFIHGCFWHSCPLCKIPIPQRNRAYWTAKLLGNRRRDTRTKRELKKLNWRFVIIWECQLKRNPLNAISKVVELAGQRSGESLARAKPISLVP
jgi:DNA mismatch endonuclease, patch repair protein